MIKRFFLKSYFAALLGSLSALLVLVLVLMSVIGGLAGKGDKELHIKDNTVLMLRLDKTIAERKIDNPFAKFSGEEESEGLLELLAALKKGKTDDKVKGLYLRMGGVAAGSGTLESLRNGLADFKSSGKFIYTYGEVYSEKDLFLASVADSIFLYPTGFAEWNGLSYTPVFLRGLLDKLEVEPILFRVGRFKSAAESITQKQMSPENREQWETLMNDMWGHYVSKIAQARKLDVATLNQLAEKMTVRDAKSAQQHKLVDALLHRDEVETLLRNKLKLAEDDKLRLVSLGDYAPKEHKHADELEGNKIAVIYAVGEINSGEGDEESIGSEGLARQLRKVRLDKNVKAVVLRVNSPGGSALASDVIAREIALMRDQKLKTVIASYGDVAASGGYYISAMADKIVAEPTTVTGSIGVIGLLMNTEKMFNNKLGITFDQAYSKGHNLADLGNPNRKMTEYERKEIQNQVNMIYGDFVRVVQKGRNFKDSVSVDAIGQGRVWSGVRARTIGLVDTLGGLDLAIKLAAEGAGLADNYTLVYYPETKPFFESLMGKKDGDKDAEAAPSQDMQAAVAKGVEARLAGQLPQELLRFQQLARQLTDPGHIYMRQWDIPEYR